jgi:hypothetical protein
VAVLEKSEFGSVEWRQFAAQTGVRLLENAHLDLEKLEWGFSEEYTYLPVRLLGGCERSAWHFMIHHGKISGGASLPEQCLALPGFHVVAPWPLIAEASAMPYDLAGQQRRFAEEAEMWKELAAAGRLPKGRSVARPAVWPREIAIALSPDANGNGGLHNLTAVRIKSSPELQGFPFTDMGVPDFNRMSLDQKHRFYQLLGL